MVLKEQLLSYRPSRLLSRDVLFTTFLQLMNFVLYMIFDLAYAIHNVNQYLFRIQLFQETPIYHVTTEY